MTDAPTVAALAALAIVVAYWWRGDFAAYSVFTVGVFKRLDRASANATGRECAELGCEVPVEAGERRRWYKDLVVAGLVLARYGGGEAVYCAQHTSFEFRHTWEPDDPTATQRLATTLTEGVVELVAWRAERRESRGPFEDVAATTGSVFSLLPILLVVLVTALMMAAVNGFGGRSA